MPKYLSPDIRKLNEEIKELKNQIKIIKQKILLLRNNNKDERKKKLDINDNLTLIFD